MEERNHIERLHQGKAKNDSNSISLARTLQKDITTAFKGRHKFIFELLQNADDAAVGPIDVCFSLITVNQSNYLIFSHNGQHFTAQDVERICDNAQQSEHSKSAASEKIGYKGIGFKAVFSIADSAYIFSRNYQFRFDKNYSNWQKEALCGKPFPWQIIPIWTEDKDIPNQLIRQLDRTRVNFIFRLIPRTDIKPDLDFITQYPQLLLFLRNVQHIQNKNLIQTTTIEMAKRTINEKIVEKAILMNQRIVNTWWLYELSFSIPNHEKSFLQNLEDCECPIRLKNASSTKITFAIPICENGTRVDHAAQKNLALFCYLPTQVKGDLPFLINADFLLNAERTQLVDNIWNDFLLCQIAYYQFHLLATLTTFPLRNKILHFLSDPYIKNVSEGCAQAFTSGFMQGKKEVAFIPAFKQDELLLCENAVVDNFHFFEEFSLGSYTNIVEYQLENKELLQETLQVSEFTATQLCEFIIDYPKIRDIDFQVALLRFLRKISHHHVELLELLKTTTFILTANNQLAAPSQLFFFLQTDIEIPKGLLVEILHPHLTKLDIDVKSWMKNQLTVQEGGILPILRTCGFSILQDPQQCNDPQKLLAVTLLAFQAFRLRCLQRQDVEFLAQHLLLITCKNGLIKTSKAYLSKVYNPLLILDDKIIADIFVSPLYLEAYIKYREMNEKSALWKEFFIAIGVRDTLKLEFVERFNVQEAQRKEIYGIDGYISSLEIKNISPKTKKYDRFYFENFYYFPFIEYISYHPLLANCFWEEIKRNWENIQNRMPKFIPASGPKREMQGYSYLQYLLGEIKLLVSTRSKNRRYNSIELFSPDLKNFRDYVDVIEIPIEFNKEQSACFTYFGFKTQLTFDNCLFLLNQLDATSCTNSQDYALLFKHLLILNLQETQKRTLRFWSGRLLAQNNTLQKKENLACFAVDKQHAPLNAPNYLKELPGITREQLTQISQLFHIKLFSQFTEGKLTYTEPKVDNSSHQEILAYLPAIAHLVSHLNGEIAKDVYAQILEKFNHLTCYVVNRMTLNFEKFNQPITVCLRGDSLYYTKDWRRDLHKLVQNLIKYLNIDERFEERIYELFSSSSIEEWAQYHSVSIEKLLEIKESIKVVTPPKETLILTTNSMEHEVISSVPNKLLQIPQAEIVSIDSTVEKNFYTDELPIIQTTAEEQLETEKNTNMPVVTMKKMPIPIARDDKSLSLAPIELQQAQEKEMSFVSDAIEENSNMNKSLPLAQTMSSNSFKVSITTGNLAPISSASALAPKVHRKPRKFSGEKTHLSDEEKLRIGRKGEEIVYGKLRLNYSQKYALPNYNVKEDDTGFVVENVNDGSIKIKVIWHNKKGESYKPKDFTVYKEEKEEKKRIIEVKSTPSKVKHSFDISAHEYQKLEKHKNRYSFFRVYGIESPDPEIYKIKNPSEAIKNRTLNMDVKTYKLKYQRKASEEPKQENLSNKLKT